VIHSFDGTDGEDPDSTLVFDASGNLYGTTQQGGHVIPCPSSGCGVVFKLSNNGDGSWSETVLHAFIGMDGSALIGPLASISSGIYMSPPNPEVPIPTAEFSIWFHFPTAPGASTYRTISLEAPTAPRRRQESLCIFLEFSVRLRRSGVAFRIKP